MSTMPSLETPHDDEDQETPAVVIYLIDPFSIGNDQPELQRIACLALLRCFQSVLTSVPEGIRSNISVQVSDTNCVRFSFNLYFSRFRLSH